jgi:hypothetical protein
MSVQAKKIVKNTATATASKAEPKNVKAKSDEVVEEKTDKKKKLVFNESGTTMTYEELKEVFDANNGNIFVAKTDGVVDKKTKNGYDTTYLDVYVKRKDGTLSRFEYNFANVLSFSAIKNSGKNSNSNANPSEKKIPRNYGVAFKRLTAEEIKTGDYAPNGKISDKLLDQVVAQIKHTTNEYVDVLEMINTAFIELGNYLKLNYEQYNFSIMKSCSKIDKVEVREIKQTITKKGNVITNLAEPLYRVKVRVCENEDSTNKNVKIYNFGYVYEPKTGTDVGKKKFVPALYDAKKSKERSNAVKSKTITLKNGERIDVELTHPDTGKSLTIEDVGSVVRRMSIFTGTMQMRQLSISAQGISPDVQFKKVYVKPRQSSDSQEDKTLELIGDDICDLEEASLMIGDPNDMDDLLVGNMVQVSQPIASQAPVRQKVDEEHKGKTKIVEEPVNDTTEDDPIDPPAEDQDDETKESNEEGNGESENNADSDDTNADADPEPEPEPTPPTKTKKSEPAPKKVEAVKKTETTTKRQPKSKE